MSSKSCDCVTFVTFRILKYLLSTFLLYTPHCHMILSKQKCCLWPNGASTDSQNLTSVLHLRQSCLFLNLSCLRTFWVSGIPRYFYFAYSNKKYDSCRCWSCAELCEAFTFLLENIYVQLDGIVY